jgi:hypothetical protein
MAIFSYVATATTNATSAWAKPATLTGWSIVNTSAAIKYVRIYNKATAPVPASDAALIIARIPLPAGQVSNLHIGAGAVWLSAGLAFDITGAAPDNDATAVTAGDVTVNLFFA